MKREWTRRQALRAMAIFGTITASLSQMAVSCSNLFTEILAYISVGLQGFASIVTVSYTHLQPEVEIPQRDACDDRKRLPVKVILQHWRVASPRPRAATVRPLAQSAFVEKDDRSPLFLGFFLMSGQVTFFQWRMACSLRSSARPTGRWQLQPSATRIFHTWPG